MLLTPIPPVTNCHTFSDPLPSSVTYFMDGPFTATFGQIILFLFKSYHFRTHFLYMIRYNNISRPRPPPPLPKIWWSRSPNPPGLTPLHPVLTSTRRGQAKVDACGRGKGKAPSRRSHRKLVPTDIILSSLVLSLKEVGIFDTSISSFNRIENGDFSSI